MTTCIGDVIRFQDERLFNGAVNIDWCLDDPERASRAAAAFVFHGPTYHGVTQGDVGGGHGHRLQDTASFTHSIVRTCAGLSEKPFTLAIAGYGTGKSHLALTLAKLLSAPDSDAAKMVLEGLRSADISIASDIEKLLHGIAKPCLTISLNGMQNFDLTAEISKQILLQVRHHDADTSPLDNLRPRFSEAASRVKIMASNPELMQSLIDCSDLDNLESILNSLELQNEKIYDALCPLFEQTGLRIPVHGGESLKDLFDVVCKEYCGTTPGKPFSSIIVLFDEFGRYAEFATMKRQIAGSGVLQHLFEGIQNNSDKASFIGFIQFELNSYVQRIAPEFKNDIIRVTTRYQNADKSYLSTNLETLIAHLIEKKSSVIDGWFDDDHSRNGSARIMKTINEWFPTSLQHHLWGDAEQFHKVIRKGCWPLSPCAVWLLYYLSAAGRHLQERSALSLLSNSIKKYRERPAEINGQPCVLSTTDLWSEELLQEFIASEESGQQGTIAHSYATVYSKHSNRLNLVQNTLLQAIVLAAKLGLSAKGRDDAESALSYLSGMPVSQTHEALKLLQNEYNVIEWDGNFQLFDILGEAVPRTQFLSFLRQRVASAFDGRAKADLFSSHISKWCDSVSDLECDFSEENDITTKEWGYQCVTSNSQTLSTHIKFAADAWKKSLAVDDKRGTVIYCYIGPDEDFDKIENDTSLILRTSAQSLEQKYLPIFVVFIVDETTDIGRMMAELAVLDDAISEQDKARFGNLIGAHTEKTRQLLARSIDTAIKERRYVTGLREPLQAQRLNQLGTELFGAVYKKPLPFPFDGFSTAKGNAADSCLQLTTDLLGGRLDFESCCAKPQKIRNRALAVLQRSWDCFGRDGKISTPKAIIARSIVMAWRKQLDADDQQFKIVDALRSACLPPYGANLASVGLLFGVFLAPRKDNVYVVNDDGVQLDVGLWLQNDLFRGKFFDFNKIGNAEIVNIGEASAEWERLLEDWEQTETHQGKIQFLKQALELKQQVSVPPTLTYKYVHLEGNTRNSYMIVKSIEKKQDDAWDQIDKGFRHGDAAKTSWGAATLAKLAKQKEAESEWTDNERSIIENDVGRARQLLIEVFPEWLPSQILRTDKPDEVGKFKHHLGSKIYGNLVLLNLLDEAEALKDRVGKQVQNCQIQATVNRLIQEVDSWLTEHSEVFRIVRIAEIRGLLTPSKEFTKKLEVAARRVKLPELDEIRTRLISFIKDLKNAESHLSEKADSLWDSKICCCNDIAPLLHDVNDLMHTYEGCDTDLEDLRSMHKALMIFQDSYSKLNNLFLDWERYKALLNNLKSEAATRYGDDDPPPWDIDDTIDVLAEEISTQRMTVSKEWLTRFEVQEERIFEMNVNDADALLKEVQHPSPLLSHAQQETAYRIGMKAEARCQELKVDWLLQRFEELPEMARTTFLERVRGVAKK